MIGIYEVGTEAIGQGWPIVVAVVVVMTVYLGWLWIVKLKNKG